MSVKIDVPDGISGAWEVSTFTIDKNQAARTFIAWRDRYVAPGKYKRITRDRDCIMSNTPAEMRELGPFVCRVGKAKNILINGLGLGVAVQIAIQEKGIESITVIENSPDVIKLVAPTYLKDKRVTIIEADAFKHKPPVGIKYDMVWHDIWDTICGDNLDEMSTLHRKYGRRSVWQDSWCKKRCLKIRRESKEEERRAKMFHQIVGGSTDVALM